MAHWAELDEDSNVIRVTVGDNNDPNGDEGYQWLLDNLGGTWIQTSYNGTIRKNFAAIGFTYDAALDAFIPPKPFESWVLDETIAQWKAPIDKPDNGFLYEWIEATQEWQLLDFSDQSNN